MCELILPKPTAVHATAAMASTTAVHASTSVHVRASTSVRRARAAKIILFGLGLHEIPEWVAVQGVTRLLGRPSRGS